MDLGTDVQTSRAPTRTSLAPPLLSPSSPQAFQAFQAAQGNRTARAALYKGEGSVRKSVNLGAVNVLFRKLSCSSLGTSGTGRASAFTFQTHRFFDSKEKFFSLLEPHGTCSRGFGRFRAQHRTLDLWRRLGLGALKRSRERE